MIVSTSHVDRKIDFAEGEEERADWERIYRALGDIRGRGGMEGGDQAESVQHFCAVTAATPEQARFFLESCAWQLETAIHSFFENDAGPVPISPQDYDEQREEEEREEEEEDEDDDDEFIPATEASRTGTSAAATVPVVVAGTGQNRRGSLSAGPTQGTGSFGAASGGSRPKSGKGKAVARSNGGRGGITTLSDLNKHPDSDSDSDGPQEYYTGGEKSGMMVQDPTHKNNRDVDSIFDRARQFGAREGIEAPPAPNSRGAFSGQGRTLSGALPEQRQTPIAPAPPTPVFHTITFWRNGFTVDGGPLRRLDDPANAPFLASINKTECPRELEPADRNTPVHVNLVKKDEEFQAPPEPKYVAFQGTGRTLGSSIQPVDAVLAPPAATPVAREFSNQLLQGLVVDATKPATSIQLRLQDGTRLVARFNHAHTVADIRGFIDAARPGNSGPYSLQSMGFPPKQLSDPTQTVEQAGLINAVVIQK